LTAIYEPQGAAREYAELAVNLYRGCGHRCAYCSSPGILRMSREEFDSGAVPRDGILEALKREAPAAADRPNSFAENRLCIAASPASPPRIHGAASTALRKFVGCARRWPPPSLSRWKPRFCTTAGHRATRSPPSLSRWKP